eukprot:1811994-Rhodomonas_salina.1
MQLPTRIQRVWSCSNAYHAVANAHPTRETRVHSRFRAAARWKRRMGMGGRMQGACLAVGEG